MFHFIHAYVHIYWKTTYIYIYIKNNFRRGRCDGVEGVFVWRVTSDRTGFVFALMRLRMRAGEFFKFFYICL